MLSDNVQNLCFSSLASLIARTITFPLDTIKTRRQNDTKTRFNLRSSFNGLPITLLFSVPASALYFTTYDVAKKNIPFNGFMKHTLAAIAAEGIASFLFTPMEVIKQKLQVCPQSSTMSIVRNLYQSHGLGGFYKGYFITQIVFVPYTISYFVTYEKLKGMFSMNFDARQMSSGLPLHLYVLCSSIAATIAGIISNPMEVVKTRCQINTGIPAKQILLELYRKEGLKGFRKGMLARIAWVTPSMTISISLFETFKDLSTKHQSAN
jgi:hypothetical protein